MKILFFVLISLIFSLQKAFAGTDSFYSDRTIDYATSNGQVAEEGTPILTVGVNGSITTSGVNAIRNYGADPLRVVVYGNVFATGASAIYDYYASYGGSINVNSGYVKNDSLNLNTIDIQSLPDYKINIASGALIENVANSTSATAYAISSKYYENTDPNLKFISINNAGTISGPSAVYIVQYDLPSRSDTLGYLAINEIINTGTIASTLSNLTDRYAIRLAELGSATVDNSGTITGNIKVDTGKIQLTNSGTITGNIDLGSNGDSFINLEAGNVTGNITLGNTSQVIDIAGGSFSGAINGTAANQGTVNVKNNFTLGSSSSLGLGNAIGTVNVKNNSSLTAQGSAKINTLNIEAGSSVKLESNDILATTTSLAGTLNFGESSRSFASNITGKGSGVVNLSSGSQTIVGNLTLNAGDTLGVTFASNGSVGNLTTTGAANVSADAKIAVTIGAAYTYLEDGSKHKILDGSSGSDVNAIKDENINVNNSNSNKAFSVLKFSSEVADDNDLYLAVSRSAAEVVTSDINAQSVYNNLNAIASSATGNLALFQQYLDGSSSQEEVNAALKSATPQSDDGIRQTSLNIVNSSFRNIENRLDQIRRKSFENARDKSNIESKKIVFKLTGALANPNKLRKQDNTPTVNNPNTNQAPKNFSAWAQTFGTNASQKEISATNGEGYNSNSSGVILGFDTAISKKSTAGVALSFANSNIKALDGLKKTNVETYQISAYSSHVFNKYFLDTMAAFALNNYSSSRAINSIGVKANASFQGETYSAKVRSGFTQKLNDKFSLVPETSLTFSNNSTNGYLEDNAGTMNLNVQSNQSNFLEGRVGLNLVYTAITKNGFEISPQLKTSYGYDFAGKRQSTVSNFSGQSLSFTTQSAQYDKSSLRVGGAVDFYKINSVTLSSEYTFEKKTQYESHSAFLRGSYRFNSY